jgi:hypothetical protein
MQCLGLKTGEHEVRPYQAPGTLCSLRVGVKLVFALPGTLRRVGANLVFALPGTVRRVGANLVFARP